MTGIIAVIEGIDGSGKGTQKELLFNRLQQEGVPVQTHSFPTYGSEGAKAVESYLRKEFGTLNLIPPEAASMFFAMDRERRVPIIRADLEKGFHYIMDRYVSANAGHQGGRIRAYRNCETDADFERELQSFLDWLLDLEYNRFRIPKPNATVFLDQDPFVGQQLVDEKKGREYLGEAKRDAHEEDIQHLIDAQAAYRYIARNNEDWVTIQCLKPEIIWDIGKIRNLGIPGKAKMRSEEDIHEQIYQVVRPLIK